MSGNMFSGAKKVTPQTRIDEIRSQGALDVEVKLVYHSARVPEELSRAVKRLAVDNDTSVQALTTEALEMLLQKYSDQ